MGKTNCGDEELAFLASAIKEGRTSQRRRLQMQLALNRRRLFFKFGLPATIAYSQRNSTVPRPVHSCHRFLQDSFFCHFLSKTIMSRSMPPNRLLSNRLHFHCFQIWNTTYRSVYAHPGSIFHALKARGKYIFPLFLPFCSKRSKQALYA